MIEVPTSSAVSTWVSHFVNVAYDPHMKSSVPTNCSMLLACVQVCMRNHYFGEITEEAIACESTLSEPSVVQVDLNFYD